MHTTQEAPVAEPHPVPGPSREALAPSPGRDGLAVLDARGVHHAFGELEAIEAVDLARRDGRSGGRRRRVAFLRTLLAGKPVLLLDEPFAGLDAITRGEMQEWLATALADGGRTAVLVTHDVEEALYLSDRVLVLSR